MNQRPYRYVVCDVFTDRALEGNALCVFPDAQGLESAEMQQLARETNLSETTFVLPAEQGGDAKVRIFTPRQELPFAGHPTLGTAFVLAEMHAGAEVRLELGIGPILVRITREGGLPKFGWMQQPFPTSAEPDDAEGVLRALGIARSTLPIVVYDNGPRHVLVGVESKQALRALEPDFRALERAANAGVGVFCVEGDSVSVRYFAPHAGVPEDPATGSAAGPLALHLLRHGSWTRGRELVVEQGGGLGRPSRLFARVIEDEEASRVEVGGAAVVVARGEFLVPSA